MLEEKTMHLAELKQKTIADLNEVARELKVGREIREVGDVSHIVAPSAATPSTDNPAEDLVRAWGPDPAVRRRVSWPLAIHAGRP